MPRGRLGNYIRKIIHSEQEKKVSDLYFSLQATDDGDIFDLSQFRAIIPGETINERSGLSIDVTSISVRGSIFIVTPILEEIPPPLNSVCRLIFFQWFSDPFANQPTVEDIIRHYEGGTVASAAYNVWSPYNKENAGKYHILFDKMYTLSLDGESRKNVHFLTHKIPLKTIPYSESEGSPEFYNTTGTIYGLAISDVDEALLAPPEFSYVSRLTFTDS